MAHRFFCVKKAPVLCLSIQLVWRSVLNSFCSELNTISQKLHAVLSSSLEEIRKGRYTLGDKLQQHVAATYHSMCTGRATSCSNKVRRHFAATNRFVCTGEFLWKSLSLQQNFVSATSRTDSVWFDFLRLVAATKFCCGDKDFHKNSPVHTKRFVAATCRLTLLLQLVALPVHMEWYVAGTCCCILSPSVYRPLGL